MAGASGNSIINRISPQTMALEQDIVMNNVATRIRGLVSLKVRPISSFAAILSLYTLSTCGSIEHQVTQFRIL